MNPALADLECALDRLEAVLLSPEEEKEPGTLAPPFRECFDLACAAIRETADPGREDPSAPLPCLRMAFRAGWLWEEEVWLAMYRDWSHATDGGIEDFGGFFRRLPHYLRAFERLGDALARHRARPAS